MRKCDLGLVIHLKECGSPARRVALFLSSFLRSGRHSPIVQPWFRSRPGAEGPTARLLPQRPKIQPLGSPGRDYRQQKPPKTDVELMKPRQVTNVWPHKDICDCRVRVNFQDPRIFFFFFSSSWDDARLRNRFSCWWKKVCAVCVHVCVSIWGIKKTKLVALFLFFFFLHLIKSSSV